MTVIASGPSPAPHVERAAEIASAILDLPVGHTSDDVWSLFDASEYPLFHFMDETPAHECFTGIDREWHRRLRVARNDPEATWPFS